MIRADDSGDRNGVRGAYIQAMTQVPDNPVTDNPSKGRYELVEQGHTAYADYRKEPGRLYIDYVLAPPPLRGTGAAGRLMEGVVAAAREGGLKITPLCGYAAAWLRRHSEHHDVLA